MNDKISNNPSNAKFRNEIENFEKLGKIYKFFRFFGIKNKAFDDILEQIPNFKLQLKELTEIPDRFNSLFSERGWIAYESMNFDTMKQSVLLAEQGKIDEAETLLINYYKNDDNKYLIYTLKALDEIIPRYDLILKAYEDFRAERYHACVPVFLMMIDGLAADIIKKNKGFFADNADISALDAIAGHSTGLNVIAKIFRQDRKGLTTEMIKIPYRNGILHGRDLNYDNEYVASKTFATLIALKDWAIEFKKGKTELDFLIQEKTFSENLSDLQNSIQEYSKIQDFKKEIDNWKPRKIEINVDIPQSGTVSDYKLGTPERELVQFFEYWQTKKYGKIPELLQTDEIKRSSLKKLAGKFRDMLSDYTLISFEIKQIIDSAAAISNISTIINVENEKNMYSKLIEFRMINEDDNGKTIVFGNPSGKWKIINNKFHEIECIKFA